MKSKLSVMLAGLFIAAIFISASAFAQQPAPQAATSESAQVEQLKAELAKMKAEMEAMRQSSKNMSPQDRQLMEQHLGRMQGYWQNMYDDCGMMGPGYMMH
jgi:cell division protein FtsB